MASIEEKIKDFVKQQGVSVVGIAGPDRLNGPPSLDPTYIMSGARSAIVFALPMDTSAIYDFLSKKSATSHNIDQKRKDQMAYWIGHRTQEYLESLGYRARVVPTNSDYRRSPYLFSTHPKTENREPKTF